MPKYEEWTADGILTRRVITDDEGNVIEEWPPADAAG